MMKALYVLPVLAVLSVLGLFSVADATTEPERADKLDKRIDKLQERIDRLEARIDAAYQTINEWKIPRWQDQIEKLEGRIAELEALKDTDNYIAELEAKITKLEARKQVLEERKAGLDPAADQAKISKIQDRIDKLDERIAAFQAKIAALAPPPDTTAPTFVSGIIDKSTWTLTLTFSETIDVSETKLRKMVLGGEDLSTSNASVSSTADSATLEIAIGQPLQATLATTDPIQITFKANAVEDTSQNGIERSNDNNLDIEGAN